MSDQANNGPIMLSATSVLKQGPARIGSITKQVKLPRTILLKTFVSVIVYGFIGLIIGLLIGGLKAMLYSTIVFSAGAYFATNYSPLRGETLSKYIGLSIKAQRERRYINGKLVKIYVGIVPISRPALGKFVLWPGGINISSTNYDERGVLINKKYATTTEIKSSDGDLT